MILDIFHSFILCTVHSCMNLFTLYSLSLVKNVLKTRWHPLLQSPANLRLVCVLAIWKQYQKKWARAYLVVTKYSLFDLFSSKALFHSFAQFSGQRKYAELRQNFVEIVPKTLQIPFLGCQKTKIFCGSMPPDPRSITAGYVPANSKIYFRCPCVENIFLST